MDANKRPNSMVIEFIDDRPARDLFKLIQDSGYYLRFKSTGHVIARRDTSVIRIPQFNGRN